MLTKYIISVLYIQGRYDMTIPCHVKDRLITNTWPRHALFKNQETHIKYLLEMHSKRSRVKQSSPPTLFVSILLKCKIRQSWLSREWRGTGAMVTSPLAQASIAPLSHVRASVDQCVLALINIKSWSKA